MIMIHKIFTKIVVIVCNLLMLPIVLIHRLVYKEVYGFQIYLETNEITENEVYAYIIRPFNICGLISDYVDWSKDYPQYDKGVRKVSLPLVLIDMKSIKEGDVIVFDSFEKFDEYRENRDKPNKTNGFIIKKLMTTTQRRRGLFLQ